MVILNTRPFVRQRILHPTWNFTQPTPSPHCLRKWCHNVSTYVRWSRDGIANGKRWANQSLAARQCMSSWRSAHRVLLVRKFRLRCVNCRNVMVQLIPFLPSLFVFVLHFCCSSYYVAYFSDFPLYGVSFSHFFVFSSFFFSVSLSFCRLPFTI